jgi:hypothetical protein
MAVAHEIVHMFVTFLNGDEDQHTPKRTGYDPETGFSHAVRSDSSCSDGSDDEIDSGHSGRLWEYYMWEGIAEYSYLRERPTRGLIYISREGTRRGQVDEYMIPDGIARELAEEGRGKFHFPFPAVQGEGEESPGLESRHRMLTS